MECYRHMLRSCCKRRKCVLLVTFVVYTLLQYLMLNSFLSGSWSFQAYDLQIGEQIFLKPRAPFASTQTLLLTLEDLKIERNYSNISDKKILNRQVNHKLILEDLKIEGNYSNISDKKILNRQVNHKLTQEDLQIERNYSNISDKKILNRQVNHVLTLEDLQIERNYYNMSGKKIVNPVNRKFTIVNSDICRKSSVNVIIIVPSIPKHMRARKAIRETYGTISRDKTSVVNGVHIDLIVRVAFLLGRSPTESIKRHVRQEHNKYKDIIEMDFHESYQNLTMKVLHGLKWVSRYCQGVKYVIKADEDVFLNTAELMTKIRHLRLHVGNSEEVYGTLKSAGNAHKSVIRRQGIWAVSHQQLPIKYYPLYAQGNCYVMSGSLASKIVKTAQYLPYVPVEDALITGIIAGKILGAKLTRIPRNADYILKRIVPSPCTFVTNKFVSMCNMKPETMYGIWDIIHYKKYRCPPTVRRESHHLNQSMHADERHVR